MRSSDVEVVQDGTAKNMYVRIAFAFFLYASFVGFQPFSADNWFEIEATAGGAGDVARQLTYVTLLGIIGAALLLRRGAAALLSIPLGIGCILLFCFASFYWSLAPEVTLRRAGLATIVVLIVYWSFKQLGHARIFNTLFVVFAGIAIANLLSVLLIPQALHSGADSDSSLVGAWRGLHPHKNSAAPIAALGLLLFWDEFLRCSHSRGRYKFGALVVCSSIFLLGTQSSTSIAMTIAALSARKIFGVIRLRLRGRSLIPLLLPLMLMAGCAAMWAWWDELAALLASESSFTGRGGVWQILLLIYSQHPVLGVGYGALWNSGDASPVLAITASEVMLKYKQSHNGYLQILVELGAIGFIMSVFVLLVAPAKYAIDAIRGHSKYRNLYVSWFVFIVGFNMMESHFLRTDAPSWVCALVLFAALHLEQHSRNRLRGS